MTYIERQCSLPRFLRGFTLLELLVALAIFAMIAIMVYSSLGVILRTHLQTNKHASQLAHLQKTLLWLERDIEQYVARPIRDQYGDRQVALQGTNSYLELTRAGWRNPAQQKRSSLQRVAYKLEDEILWRLYWSVLDRAQDTSLKKVNLLSGIKEIQLHYLDTSLQWHQQWPSNDFLNNGTADLPMLKAIKVILTVADWGKITRLFRVPEQNVKPTKNDDTMQVS